MKRKAENQLESPDPQKKLPSESENEETTENKVVQEENKAENEVQNKEEHVVENKEGEENKEENKEGEKEISKDTNTTTFPFFSSSSTSSSNFSFFNLPKEQNAESGFKSPFSFSFPSTTENPFGNFSGGSLFSSSTSSEGATLSFPFSTPPSIESSENNTPTLQEAVNVVTGEEDEEHVFVIKAKAFRFVKPQWKERGQGCLKVNVSKTTGKSRIVMRNDKTLQLILNVPLVKESRVKKFGEKDVQVFSVDLSEGQTKPNYAPILIRVKSASECADLYSAITKQIPDFVEKSENSSTPKKTTSEATAEATSESTSSDASSVNNSELKNDENPSTTVGNNAETDF